LLVGAGDLKSALSTLDVAEKEYPDDADLKYTRATVLETAGKTKDAIDAFEAALKRRPDDPQLLNALGFTLADHKQQLGRAEQMVRTALAVSPDNPAIQDSVGWLLYKRGKNSQALQMLARAWQNSGDVEIASHYGEVLWKAGQQDKARYVWQQALISEPEHLHLREVMSRLTGEEATPP
jgi:Tfp pilus assembly protein PilF